MPRLRVLLALAALSTLAACTAPVRFATPAEIKQANAPSPATGSTPGASGPLGATGVAPAPSPAPAPPLGSGALATLQGELRQLIASVMPSVVEIDTAQGLGSGIVLDAQGDIVTNAHVVGSDRTFTVIASDGHSYPGTFVGSYPADDLAVIKAGGGALKPAAFGDSSAVQLGDIVVAIGSPLGLTDSVSEGIVSGTGRSQSEGGGVTLTGLIQITAAINPGNSGGALVNINGQVIGIPTLAGGSGRGGAATNIGFAIPSNQVTSITNQLASGGAVTHTNQPYLGISVSDGPNGEALIASVVSGAPADRAGIKSGWIITRIGGRAVPDPASVTQVLSTYKPGDRVDVVLTLSDGSSRTVSVTLGERPASP